MGYLYRDNQTSTNPKLGEEGIIHMDAPFKEEFDRVLWEWAHENHEIYRGYTKNMLHVEHNMPTWFQNLK